VTGSWSEAEIAEALARLGLVAAQTPIEVRPLTGGVSSDIHLVTAGTRRFCIKRALSRLKVAQLWEAGVERNRYEWQWYRTVAAIAPDAVPPLFACDEAAGFFVMGYLDPASHFLWKERLAAGDPRLADARAVAGQLAAIHAATAGRADLARAFATDGNFYALRLEPYLIATGRVHRELEPILEPILAAIADDTAATRHALVHGDVSPKNIMLGPAGPVFLDAECAWYGDPAFDLAFCLNHLLLKCLMRRDCAAQFLALFRGFAERYRAGVRWEPADDLERRAARLLPGLFLARVDGKSPVEYVTAEADKNLVRQVARRLLFDPPSRLEAIADAWAKEIEA
jgi:aminoglycoside phosphotransferase (APT) family kinase protein